jgi:hypothetical protein
LALALILLFVWLLSFFVFDRGWGVLRLVLLALGLGGMAALTLLRPGRDGGAAPAALRPILFGLVIGALAGDLALGAASVIHSARSGEIRMDQGEATYRAALMLAHGEDPWGRRALLDPEAYLRRLPQLMALGDAPAQSPAEIDAMLRRYWQTLDPDLRSALLPPPPSGAAGESAMLGYKYGPVPVLATLPAALWLGPAAVPLMELTATIALFVVLALLLSESVAGEAFLMALAALLLDPHMLRNFLYLTASDVWPLLFGAAAVLSARKGAPVMMGTALALALASKLVPALLYLPLLAAHLSWRTAGACAVVTVLLYAPFAWWDGMGLAHDLLLWPMAMAPDDTSWIADAPAWAVAATRIALGVVIMWLAMRWTRGREARTLAMLAILAVAAAPQFHNNYVPWFSVWMVLAVAEAITGPARERQVILDV